MPFLNSEMLSPKARARTGNREEPNIRRTIAKTSSSFQINQQSPQCRSHNVWLNIDSAGTYYQFYRVTGSSQTSAAQEDAGKTGLPPKICL